VRFTRVAELRLSTKGTIKPRLSNRNAFPVNASVSLRSLGRVGGRRLALATASVSIPAKAGALSTLKLSSANRRLVARLGRLRVLVTITVEDAAGERRELDAAFDLLRPKAARR
jgi:hypothetical protein